MPSDSPLSVITTSSVHSLVSPPGPHPQPWTSKDGLYKERDYLTLTTWVHRFSWPMRNNHFLLYVLFQSTAKVCTFYQPKGSDSEYFFSKLYPKSTVKTNLLLTVFGHALREISEVCEYLEGTLIARPNLFFLCHSCYI